MIIIIKVIAQKKSRMGKYVKKRVRFTMHPRIVEVL